MKTIDAFVIATCCAVSHFACSSKSDPESESSGGSTSSDGSGDESENDDDGGQGGASGSSGSSNNPGSSTDDNERLLDGGVDDNPPLVWAADGGLGEVSDEPASCDTSVITVEFSPMYSAYDGVHLFQVPATVVSIDPAAITWSLSDPEIANLAIVPNGVMLTIQKPGTATLIATAGTICGTSELTVTEFDPEQWEIGSARYNNGEILTRPVGPGGPGGPMSSGEPIEAACTSCHGESATNGTFQTVAHTPGQTGGFSDDELFAIITEAILPEGAYFDESIIQKEIWQTFHKWKMEGEQREGIISYLRSLTPTAQTGAFNFGNAMMNPGADGGFAGPP
jgi:hypothetical protein